VKTANLERGKFSSKSRERSAKKKNASKERKKMGRTGWIRWDRPKRKKKKEVESGHGEKSAKTEKKSDAGMYKAGRGKKIMCSYAKHMVA